MIKKQLSTVSSKEWLPLDIVARELARELLQSEPPSTLTSNPEAHGKLWEDIRHDFHSMIEREAVTLRHHTPKGFTKLSIDKALHEFTFFDFEKSTVCVAGEPELLFVVLVNARDLNAFLKNVLSERHGFQNQRDRENACRDWLETELPNAQPGERNNTISEATKRFGVSRNFAMEARSQTISKLGLTKLSRPGRPKKSS